MEEMIYTPTFGERVTHVISVMHTVATANNCNVKASFNDYELTVTPSDNPTEILSKYNEEMDKREAEYKSSVRYKQLKEDFEQRKNVQRRRLELLCKHYPNFKDIEAVIDWLEKVSECDLIQLRDSGIIETFEVNGYFAASSIHIEEYVSDKDTSGKWLVKQALDFIIKFGTIYPMFKKHVQEWKDKYGVL